MEKRINTKSPGKVTEEMRQTIARVSNLNALELTGNQIDRVRMFLEGMSISEIARRTGVSISSARQTIIQVEARAHRVNSQMTPEERHGRKINKSK